MTDILALDAAGVDITPAKPRSKSFAFTDAFNLPRISAADLIRYQEENPHTNWKARLGRKSMITFDVALIILDRDVRLSDSGAIQESELYLDKLWPSWREAPYVHTGRGDGSQHIYMGVRGTIPKDMVIWGSKKTSSDHGKPAVEIELKTRDCMLPPSLHPSGKKYVWGKPFDATWLIKNAVRFDIPDANDFADEAGKGTEKQDESEYRALTPVDVAAIVLNLPTDYIDEYDAWLKLGCALYNESDDADWGLELWDYVSQLSISYKDGDCQKKWRTFGNSYNGNRIGIGTLIMASNEARDEMADAKRNGRACSIRTIQDALEGEGGNIMEALNG
jgi:hypothetical protein